jgi:uncharacterized protein YndB with AHSA1/START domain
MSTNKQNAARAVADLNEGVIMASVEIKASPERVYRALTTPEELTRWWGSADTYRTTSWVHELRVGGSYHASGVGADGQPFAVKGEYLVLESPSKIVQTWRADWDEGKETTVTYRITKSANGTRVTVRHDGFAGRPESCAGHQAGWEMVLSWLSDFTAPEPETRTFFLCKLIGPRPTFPFDMTPDEQALMGNHAAYWASHLADGTVVVFGPVMDPGGPWGLGIVRAQDEAALRAYLAKDPVITAERGFRYETMLMMSALVGG